MNGSGLCKYRGTGAVPGKGRMLLWPLRGSGLHKIFCETVLRYVFPYRRKIKIRD